VAAQSQTGTGSEEIATVALFLASSDSSFVNESSSSLTVEQLGSNCNTLYFRSTKKWESSAGTSPLRGTSPVLFLSSRLHPLGTGGISNKSFVALLEFLMLIV
jgi:hypothetical protein